MKGFMKHIVRYNITNCKNTNTDRFSSKILSQCQSLEINNDKRIEIVKVKKNGKPVDREIDHTQTAKSINQIGSLIKKDLDDLFRDV